MTLLRMGECRHANLSESVALGNYEPVSEAKPGGLGRVDFRTGIMVGRALDRVLGRYGGSGHHIAIVVQAWTAMGGLYAAAARNDAEQQRRPWVLVLLGLDQAGDESEHQPQLVEGQAAQPYTVLQFAVDDQRTSEPLGTSPGARRLMQHLDEYDPGHLAEMVGSSSHQHAGTDEQ